MLLQLDRYEKNILDELVRKSGKSKSSVIRGMIEGCKIHEKPTDELYDLLYDINTLSSDINKLITRIDCGIATRGHLEYVVEKIDKFYDTLAAKYIY